MLKRLAAAAAVALALAGRPAPLHAQALPSPRLAAPTDARLIAPAATVRPAAAVQMSDGDLIWTGGFLGAVAGLILFYLTEGRDHCGGAEVMGCELGYPLSAVFGAILGSLAGAAIGEFRK
ncbi:MAG TPA: hypothetical protein VF665_20285 [Longimicrobium sp.]|jgi:hypothetical protein|uniref:hypothetical protein n=1 Tax=Longimicrobium sp. TaxID=2029185 RepID=UPI002ED7F6BC